VCLIQAVNATAGVTLVGEVRLIYPPSPIFDLVHRRKVAAAFGLPKMKYQLLAFGPAAANCLPDLQTEFQRQITDIGLTPGVDTELIEVATPSDVMRVDWDGAPVGIWFGAAPPFSQCTVDLVDDLLKHGHPVFPVCDSSNFSTMVPAALSAINGQPWREPEEKTTVVANALGGFQLTPRERNAFLSVTGATSRAVLPCRSLRSWSDESTMPFWIQLLWMRVSRFRKF
jgi:hypothetical protein